MRRRTGDKLEALPVEVAGDDAEADFGSADAGLRPDAWSAGRSHPLGRTIAEWLGNEIVLGRLEPGSRLVVSELVARLGVSETPLREAFRVLAGEGLVRIESRRGAWVSEIDPAEIDDIYACRAYLQGLAVRQCAERATPADFAELSEAIGRMRTAAERQDLRAFFHENVQLHFTVGRVARNATLAQLTRQLGRRTLRLRFLSMSRPGRMATSLAAHDEIISLVLARDGERAELAMRTAILDAGRALHNLYGVATDD